MTLALWLLFGAVAWIGISVLVGLLVGRLIERGQR